MRRPQKLRGREAGLKEKNLEAEVTGFFRDATWQMVQITEDGA